MIHYRLAVLVMISISFPALAQNRLPIVDMHFVHFADGLSDLTWQPSDPDAELRERSFRPDSEHRRV